MTDLPCGCDDRAVGGCTHATANTATQFDRLFAAALVALCVLIVVAGIAAEVLCG